MEWSTVYACPCEVLHLDYVGLGRLRFSTRKRLWLDRIVARGLPHKSLLLFPEVNAAEAGFVELFKLLCVSMLNRVPTHLILALGALGCGSRWPHGIFLLGTGFQSLFIQVAIRGLIIFVDGQITMWELLIIFFAFLFIPS